MCRRIRWWWACPHGRSGKWKENRRVSSHRDTETRRELFSLCLSRRISGRCMTQWRMDKVVMTITQIDKQALIDAANTVRQHAYVPYSNYRVGAAVQTKSGRVFTGVNVENASYPETMCAERVAIFKAVSEGEKDFDVIAVFTDIGGSACG